MLSPRSTCLILGLVFIHCPRMVSAQQRELILPEGFQHGSISLFEQPKNATYMTGIVRFPYKGDFFCSAQGTIRVPEAAWVSIEIEGRSGYESFVDSLPAKGIDRLEFRDATISTSLIASIEKLESLRQLVFAGCRVDDIDASELAGSPTLQSLSIRHPDSEAQWRSLMPWLSECTAIQFWFEGRPVSATDLKKLSNRTAPAFLSVNLDENTEDVLDALERIPGLVGLEMAISADVSVADLNRVANLEKVELVVLNNGILNANLVGLLAQLPNVKVLRVQGSTKVGDFLEGGFPLRSIQEVTFTQPLKSDLNKRFVDVCLQIDSLRKLPNLENVTESQLRKLARRSKYTDLFFYGLDKSANESLLAEVILSNPDLKQLTLANLQVTAELGAAISACSHLERLRLATDRLDGSYLQPAKLPNVRHLSISSKKQPLSLGMLRRFQGLTHLVASFETLDPMDCASLASIPSLESLIIDSGLCDSSTALEVGRSKCIERLVCRQDCLFDDAAISELLKNDRLIHLDIGGRLSERAIERLGALPNLKTLEVQSNEIDGMAKERLRTQLRHLEYFQVRPLRLSMGAIAKGDDGFERWVPDGGRRVFDELEGNSIDELFGGRQIQVMEAVVDGKMTLVEFWGTWCGPCLGYEPELERLHQKYYQDGLRIISVHSERGQEQASNYLRLHPKPWKSITDETGDIARSFKVSSFPSLYLFDGTGRLLVALPHRLALEQTIKSLVEAKR